MRRSVLAGFFVVLGCNGGHGLPVQECVPGALALPPAVYAVEGTPARVVFDDAADEPGSMFSARSDVGVSDARGWSLTPLAGDAGARSLGIEARDASGAIVGCAATEIRVLRRPVASCNVLRILLVGDSLTEQTYYPNDLSLMFDASGISWEMLGSVSPSNCDPSLCEDALPGVHHQGYGGWTWSMYVERFVAHPSGGRLDRSSPFLFDEGGHVVLDVGRYVADTLRGETPDVAAFVLGTNDCFTTRADDPAAIDACATTMIARAETLVSAFRAALPAAALGIALTPPGNMREGAFAIFKGRYTAAGYRRIQRHLVRRELEAFSGREADGIFLIPTEVALDPDAGMAPDNAVHPNPVGYQQIADAVYAAALWHAPRSSHAASAVGCSPRGTRE